VQPSIVEVNSRGSQGQTIGSGEVIVSGGYVVTNDHVVRGFQQFQVVLADGQTVQATLVGEAPADDLAVLKVAAPTLRPIPLGNSSAVQVGSIVLAIGSPLGLDQSATLGIVSALNRTASEAPSGPAGTLTGLIQTSAPINAGNSGGALVNLRGELIGIPTLGASDPTGGGPAYGIGFAIPSNRVKYITDQLIASGRVTSTGQG
jgi:S1-C subfamily serine protease